MSILNFSKQINFTMNQSKGGWCFIVHDGKGKIKFPIEYDNKLIASLRKSKYCMEIMVLSELADQGLTVDKDDCIYINSYDYDQIPKDIVDILNLPKYFDGTFKLTSKHSVGIKTFEVSILIDNGKNDFTDLFTINENLIKTSESTFVLNTQHKELIESIQLLNDTDDTLEQFKNLSKVKALAKELGCTLDNYIDSEEVYFADDEDIDVQLNSPEKITLLPEFNTLDEETNKIIQTSSLARNYYPNQKNNKDERIFLDNQKKEFVKTIKENSTLTGVDVPKFIKNPYTYLDDSISFDLEKFSERVKGLKNLVYKAQPFVNASVGDCLDWFDFEVGVKLVSESEENEELVLNIDELDIVTNESDDEYILVDGKWIEVDKNQIATIKDLNEAYDFEESISINDTRKILEIFENIDNLEYNEVVAEIREKLSDHDLGIYQKPDGFEAILKAYQEDGHMWMRYLNYSKLGGLLADDMGLGKTVQVISYMQYLKNNNKLLPSLVVVPVALLDNWTNEIEKFSTNISYEIYHKSANSLLPEKLDEFDVYITTYDMVVRNQLKFGQVHWEIIICDEAQKIKNASTYAANAIKAMKAKRKLALTGTPVENSLSELWSIVDFVQPGILDCYKSFKVNYENPIQKSTDDAGNEVAKKLQKLIKPIYLRRTKTEKLDGLPSLETIVECVDASNLQMKLYSEQIQIGKLDSNQMLPAINRMLSILSHPRTIQKNELFETKRLINESPKLAYTIDLLKNIQIKGEKVLIFTKLREMQSILKFVFMDIFKINVSVINGDISKNRLEIIKDFEDKEGFNILILSPRAAGMGLNITGANHVVHFTRDWNPAVEKQATDRVYRIGQTRDVKVYYPTVSFKNGMESAEQKLDRLLESKKALIEKVIISKDQYEITEGDKRRIFFEE
jgi:SNF2 family DNA or RNA helicase